VTLSSCNITGNTATGVRALAQKFPSPRWELDGNIADTHLASTLACAVLELRRTCSRDLKFPNAPMGKMLTLLTRFASTLACCLQGGGVFVSSGTVSIINSQVYSNQATNVRAHAQEFPSPHLPQLTLAQLQTKRRSGQHQAVRATETLKSSYRPHGRLTCCSLFCRAASMSIQAIQAQSR
jgi:hypothetical protein